MNVGDEEQKEDRRKKMLENYEKKMRGRGGRRRWKKNVE
jgi:hypothetical protein